MRFDRSISVAGYLRSGTGFLPFRSWRIRNACPSRNKGHLSPLQQRTIRGRPLSNPGMKLILCLQRRAAAHTPRYRVAPAIAALLLVFAFAPASVAATAWTSRPARIFVLMVWDGLRPDFVSAALTPALFAMETEGVRFARHHSVFPTITMVDAASIATGAPPGRTT